jgi:hypothetical protein
MMAADAFSRRGLRRSLLRRLLAWRWFRRYALRRVLYSRAFWRLVFRLGLWRFVLYTGLGSGLWNGGFIGLGWWLGTRWELAGQYEHVVLYAVVAAISGGFSWLLWRRLSRRS